MRLTVSFQVTTIKSTHLTPFANRENPRTALTGKWGPTLRLTHAYEPHARPQTPHARPHCEHPRSNCRLLPTLRADDSHSARRRSPLWLLSAAGPRPSARKCRQLARMRQRGSLRLVIRHCFFFLWPTFLALRLTAGAELTLQQQQQQ